MSSQVVSYELDDSTAVRFEFDPVEGYREASPGHALTKIREAVTPTVEAAKMVLEKVKEICPDKIELTFGIKVSGGTDWLIARSAGEAGFEIKLTWCPGEGRLGGPGQPGAAERENSAATRKEPGEPVRE